MGSGIGVVIIARDEEARIASAIASVKPVADAVLVVVDAATSDRTAEIAEREGARVVVHVWQGYAEQRNFGLDALETPWALVLDADEVLSARAGIDAVRLARSGGCEAVAFRMKNYFGGRALAWGRYRADWHVRMFRADKYRLVGAVHEVLSPAPMRVARAGGYIEHYTYSELRELLEKAVSYGLLLGESDRLPRSRWSAPKIALGLVRDLVLRGGILDGWRGSAVAVMEAVECLIAEWRRAERGERGDERARGGSE